MKRKWFNAQTLEELKREYKTLIMKYHPDRTNGTTEIEMQEINSEFDALHEILPATNAQGNTYQPKADVRGVPAKYRAAVWAALKCEGVSVELCGSWIWATGDTKRHKDNLKAAGYQWSHNKAAWYWHEAGYKKQSRKTWSLEDIRTRFGSQSFGNPEQAEALPA